MIDEFKMKTICGIEDIMFAIEGINGIVIAVQAALCYEMGEDQYCSALYMTSEMLEQQRKNLYNIINEIRA